MTKDSVKGVEGLVRRAGRNQFIYRLSGLVRTRPGGAENRQRYFTMVFLYYVVHRYRGVGRNIELNIMVVKMCWK